MQPQKTANMCRGPWLLLTAQSLSQQVCHPVRSHECKSEQYPGVWDRKHESTMGCCTAPSCSVDMPCMIDPRSVQCSLLQCAMLPLAMS